MNETFDEHESGRDTFGHLLLIQKEPDDGSLAAALKPYYESAHLDARTVFHADIGIDLHPDADHDIDVGVTYPGGLPSKTLRGLFGEVLCGLLTESYAFVGGHTWKVPIFLFRHHQDASQYLYELARDPARKRQVRGRQGSDFIGLSLDQAGAVTRVISGEAKWRATLTPSVVEKIMRGEWTGPKGNQVRSEDGVWHRLNTEPQVPQGVRQLQRLLQMHDPDGHDAAILSLERVLVVANPDPIPKTDLVVIAGDKRARREPLERLLPFDAPPEMYVAGNDLQLVEVLFEAGGNLIDTLYASLWDETEDA